MGQYHKDNKETIKQRKKQYREDHKEEQKQYQKEYRKANKEALKQKSKQYNEANKEANKQKKSAKQVCPCGSTYSQSDKSRHKKTKKHQAYLSTLGK